MKQERNPSVKLVAVLTAALLPLFAWFTPVHAAVPFFMGLGHLPSRFMYSEANGVSDDGSVVVGTSGNEAFRWSQGSGIVGLGDLPGGPFDSAATDISADGLVVVGGSVISMGSPGSGPGGIEAFRWTQAGGMVSLGDLPGSSLPRPVTASYAFDVSADGSVIVGRGNSNRGYEAFRWTQAGGMVGLGDLPGGGFDSRAAGVSADGSVVVGYGTSGSGNQAFRWTQSGGMVGLGDLPGGIFSSGATDVSADGLVVVGSSISTSGSEAFRWTQGGGIVGLGDLPGGDFSSIAYGVSADGSVVIGQGHSASGPEAFHWNATYGIRSLRDVLDHDFGLGASLAGWTLTGPAYAISSDGQFIVGTGTNPSGNQEAWLANLVIDATIVGDYNGNGQVEQGDLDLVLLNWGADAVPPPAGWKTDLPGGLIDQAELDRVLLNWGSGTRVAGVPEPDALLLTMLSAAFVALCGGRAQGTQEARRQLTLPDAR